MSFHSDFITEITNFKFRLLNRNGPAATCDIANMHAGEMAFLTDTMQAWACFGAGKSIKISGITILDYYATSGALATAHPTGTAGQIYAVGSTPMHAYIWNTAGSVWADMGAMNDVSTFATLASPTFTGTVVLPSTTSIGNVSATELGYLDGVTSAIQTQFTGKVGATGNETIAGVKTFSSVPLFPAISKANVTFQNSWVNFGSTLRDCKYWKDALGYVHVVGMMKSGTVGAVAFILPAGFRPDNTFRLPTISNGALGSQQIKADGYYYPEFGSNAWFEVNMSFLAEN